MPWVVFGGALTIAYLPNVVDYAGNLMKLEHYQFFPLAWLGAIALFWLRRDALKPQLQVVAPVVGWISVALAALMLAVGGTLNSSWLAMVSLVPMALGMAWLFGGWSTVKGIGPALVMFSTTLRLPGSLNRELIQNLRALAVQISSRVLDTMGIIHVPWRNVLRVPGGELLVDEACSGIHSLVSVMAVVLFLGLLLRRRLLHLALLLVGSAGIVVLANVIRVSIVTIAFVRWEIDLLTGWKHDALGVALYAVSLGLVASLDQLLLLLGSMMPRWSARPDHLGRTYSAYGPSAGPFPSAGPTGVGSMDRRVSERRGAALPPRWLVPCAAAFAVIALINPVRWGYGAVNSDAGRAEVNRLVEHAHASLSEQSMPAELAGWQRTGFTIEQRDFDNPFGAYSTAWTYRLGNRQALVSLDYPFRGWHELINCYVSIDWTCNTRRVMQAEPGPIAGTPYVAASLSHPNGRFAALKFGFLDDRGHWVAPTTSNKLGLLGRKIAWETTPKYSNYQLQVFHSGFMPLSDEDQEHLSQLYEAAFQELKQQLFASGAIAP